MSARWRLDSSPLRRGVTVATLVAREAERRRAADQRRDEVEELWRENEEMQAEQARELRDALSRAIERLENQELAAPILAGTYNPFLIY